MDSGLPPFAPAPELPTGGVGSVAQAFGHGTKAPNNGGTHGDEVFGRASVGGRSRAVPMSFPFDLLINAIVAGLLLGGFYAAVTAGISIAFGILDIVNIAHPAFIILGSYIAYIVNTNYGFDPIVVSAVMLPAFYALGAVVYQVYYVSFERRGQEALRGLAFFFGLLFITEVVLILVFGVDYRYVEASYIGPTLRFGFIDLPLRMLVPCLVSLVLILLLQVYLTRTFVGRAIRRN